MAEIILAVVMFGLLVGAMSIGVLMGGKPISGSCGGVGAALGETDYTCDICGNDPNKCDEKITELIESASYNAMDVQHKSF